MPPDVDREIHERLSEVSPGRRELIRKAFRLLPGFERPRILDVGCGRGGPTLELARLGGGEVVGVDVDSRSLDALAEHTAREGLGDRVRGLHRSMSDMDFPEGSFDVIWAEASIHVVGFEAGLEAWRGFLSAQGCLVVHEMAWLQPDPPPELAAHWRSVRGVIHTVPEYLLLLRRHGYEAIGHFAVPGEFWWTEYYRPLQTLVGELRQRHGTDRGALEALDRHQREVELHRIHGRWIGSAYFVMRRRAAGHAPT